MPPRLHIAQPPSGYRYAIDALILASRARPAPGAHLVDIGTGCGVIALVLARNYPNIRITGVEIQEELAGLAAANAAANGMAERIRIERQDIRMMDSSRIGPADLVTCNPPHTARSSGRINPGSQRAIARHEILMSLEDLLAGAGRLLRKNGRLITLYPARRMPEVLRKMQASGFEPEILRLIHFKAHRPAARFLVEAVKEGQSGLQVLPPLFIQNSNGEYTREARAIFDFANIAGTPAKAGAGDFHLT